MYKEQSVGLNLHFLFYIFEFSFKLNCKICVIMINDASFLLFSDQPPKEVSESILDHFSLNFCTFIPVGVGTKGSEFYEFYWW